MLRIPLRPGLQINRLKCRSLLPMLIETKRSQSGNRQSLDQNKIVDLLMKSSKTETTRHRINKNSDFKKDFLIHDILELPEVSKSVGLFPPITYKEFDKEDIENLGALYLKYITVKYIFSTRPHKNFSEAYDYSDTVLKVVSLKFNTNDTSFLEYIGQFCITDISACNRFMEGFFIEDAKSTQFIEPFCSYFNRITPPHKANLIDFNMIWNTEIANSEIELPKLEDPENAFNPLYLVDSSHISQVLSSTMFGTTQEDARISNKLSDLQNYGKLMFEFYIVKHLFCKLDITDPLFVDIIKNIHTLFEEIINFSGLTRIVNCSQYTSIQSSKNFNFTEAFYQYVGVLDINNKAEENLVEQWVDKFLDYIIINSGVSIKILKSESHRLTPKKPIFKKQRNLPIVPCIQIGEAMTEKIFPHGYVDFAMLDEICKLGKSSISLAFKQYLVVTRLGETEYEKYKYEKEFMEVVNSHIDDSIKVKNIIPRFFSQNNIPYTGNHLVGLFLIEDFEGCIAFLNSFFAEAYDPHSFNKATNYMKWLTYDSKMPTFRIANSEVSARSPLYLPPLRDSSMITRFLMLNNSIIRPSFGSFKNKNWKRNNSLKGCLHSWHGLGNLLYKVCVQLHLINKLSQNSAPYIQEILKLLTSNNFYKTLLDNSNVFQLLENSDYESLLIEKRYMNTLVNAQFSQYLAALHITDQRAVHNWTLDLVKLFVNVIENLNSEEIIDFIHKFEHEFRKHNFSLCRNFTANIIKSIDQKDIIIDLPIINKLNQIPSAFLEDVGKYFTSYIIARFNIHYGLDSFINAKVDTLNMIEEVSQRDTIKGILGDLTFNQYIGILVFEDGIVETQNKLLKFLGVILSSKAKHMDVSRLPKFGLMLKENNVNNGFSVWGNSIQFPRLAKCDSLHNILLVNFYISRSFFLITGSHSENINELPDLCTKFNTIGGDFYNYLIRKHVYSYTEKHLLPEPIIERVITLLLDRVFMSIVCYKSGILYDPFGLDEYAKLAKKVMKNNYYFLRFSSQSFRQYMGSLCYHDINKADEWVGSLVNTLLKEISSSPTIHKKYQLLNNLESKMNSYYTQKRI